LNVIHFSTLIRVFRWRFVHVSANVFNTILFVPILLAVTFVPAAASAKDYPSKPIHFIVPSPAGAINDQVVRTISPLLAQALGQSIVVDNRGGAGGLIGTSDAARAAPDGHTIVIVATSHAIQAAANTKRSYDAIADFEPVALIGYSPFLLVANPSVPITSVKDLIVYAKANPGKLTYASAGMGSGVHMASELFKLMSGVDILNVNYKGVTAGQVDLLGGRVSIMFGNIVNTLPLVEAGKLRALGVTGPKRSQYAPQFPTIAEAGLPGYSYMGWMGVLVPKGTPKEIIVQLNEEINRIMNEPSVAKQLASYGLETAVGTPEDLAAHIRADINKWKEVIDTTGIKIQ